MDQKMSVAEQEAWRARWLAEERVPFQGWDFSYLSGRMLEEPLPWDYMEMAAAHLSRATAALDMDTGGGERILALRSHWPTKMVVTEGYAPNVALARQRLSPYGVQVVEMDSSNVAPIPLVDDEFDLVLNRHGAFNAREVARILRAGGIFLTQQVHGRFAYDLLAHFGASPPWPGATYEDAVTRLVDAGLEITNSADWRGELTFTDVGAVVYYLKAIPWLVPNFDVAHHFEQLLQLQARIEQEGELTFANMRYWVEAHQPN
jgi:SAM-dependent methyltransferase